MACFQSGAGGSWPPGHDDGRARHAAPCAIDCPRLAVPHPLKRPSVCSQSCSDPDVRSPRHRHHLLWPADVVWTLPALSCGGPPVSVDSSLRAAADAAAILRRCRCTSITRRCEVSASAPRHA